MKKAKRAAEARTPEGELFLQLGGGTESSSLPGDLSHSGEGRKSHSGERDAEVNHFLSSLSNANFGFSHCLPLELVSTSSFFWDVCQEGLAAS